MAATIEAPLEFIRELAYLRLPPQVDQHLQQLMDENTNGSNC